MRLRRTVSVLWGLVCLLGLAACGSDGSLAPKILVFSPSGNIQVFAGNTVSVRLITHDDDGPDGNPVVDVYADIDGDLNTGGDQVVIARDRAVTHGVAATINWNTNGVTPGVYQIIGVVKDNVFAVGNTATGRVTVVRFSITAPVVDRYVMEGATVNVNYLYNDPDSTPTTDIFADRDGDLGTTGDQYQVVDDQPENGGTQSIPWDTADVDPGTYFLICVNSDGAQGSGQFTAGGRVTVVTVTSISPANGTNLLSTAYNARIRLSRSLINLGATVNSSTIQVLDGAAPVPGTLQLENNQTEINFIPTDGLFRAPSSFSIRVLTNVLFQDGATTVSEQSDFTTAVSPAFVTSRNNESIAVVDVSDFENPSQVDSLGLAEGDEPYFSAAASDGKLYFSHRGGESVGGVIVYDAVAQERMGFIPFPPVFGENSTGAAGIALSPDETKVYCAGWEDDGGFDGPEGSRLFLAVIDRASMTVTNRIQLVMRGEPRNVAVSPDGARVYVANIFANDIANFEGGGEGPEALNFTFIGAIHVVNAATNQEVDADGVAGNGVSPIIPRYPLVASLAVSNDSRTLYSGHAAVGDIGEVNLGLTPGISAFDTTTFVEGAPLISRANAVATGAALLMDRQRGYLLAPRSNVLGTDPEDGLSIFDPSLPMEMIVDTTIGGGAFTMRDVDLIWGTAFAVLADVFFGVVVVDVTEPEAIGATDTNTTSHSVVTIPPVRY